MSVQRTLRTLKHLKLEQLVAQARHALGGSLRPKAVDPDRVDWAIERLAVSPLPPAAHAGWDGAGRVELVGQTVDFGSVGAIDFGYERAGALWAYQLNFFEWLRVPHVDPLARVGVLANWLRRPAASPAWDPHPISVRALSWLKLRLSSELPEGFAGSDLDLALRASLASQLDWLSRHVEVRLQANHLLENWLAVVAGGLALEAPGAARWRAAWRRLADQLDEQLGVDGAHYERSPMYHGVLLEHLLDLLSLARAAGERAPEGLVARLEAACGRMLSALDIWTHPDGEIALFGDSAFGLAQPPRALRGYADALGVTPAAPREPGLLRSTAHSRLDTRSLRWLGSLGGPSPAYQPGHAHCDALAFELSAAGERVVTDTGVYEYAEGARREQSRATRAHATLQVGSGEQAEIWAGHRVGGRPEVRLEDWVPGVAVEGSCASWSTRATRHCRRVEVDGDDILVRDRLEGSTCPVQAFLPLAPGLEPELCGAAARVGLASGEVLQIDLPGGLEWRVEHTPYFPRFGEERQRRTLVGQAACFAEGTWRFHLAR